MLSVEVSAIDAARGHSSSLGTRRFSARCTTRPRRAMLLCRLVARELGWRSRNRHEWMKGGLFAGSPFSSVVRRLFLQADPGQQQIGAANSG